MSSLNPRFVIHLLVGKEYLPSQVDHDSPLQNLRSAVQSAPRKFNVIVLVRASYSFLNSLFACSCRASKIRTGGAQLVGLAPSASAKFVEIMWLEYITTGKGMRRQVKKKLTKILTCMLCYPSSRSSACSYEVASRWIWILLVSIRPSANRKQQLWWASLSAPFADDVDSMSSLTTNMNHSYYGLSDDKLDDGGVT